MQDLSGKVAVVTGGASGIGRGMVEALLARGMKVVIADVEKEALAGTCSERAAAGEVAAVECDVSDAASVEALRDEALARFGAVHVLCNNAGVAGGGGGTVWEAPQADWDWGLGVNLMGVVYGIRSFVPVMIEQGAGHVVNTASAAGLITGMGIYGVSKHAVVALSESLFLQLQERGHPVGVSVLCPGFVRTRILESERNRPEAPRPDPGPLRPEQQMMAEIGRKLIEGGSDPADIGRFVADGIEADRFWLLPHDTFDGVIESRVRRILARENPTREVPPDLAHLLPKDS